MRNPYLELKLSLALFKKRPDALSEAERQRLLAVAQKQLRLEQSILASAQAAHVEVCAASLATRLDELRKRYKNEAEFTQDLATLQLEERELEALVRRDLRIESVLEKVAAEAAPASAVDAEIHYRLHPEAFNRPEARRLRHILLTFNKQTKKEKERTTLNALRSSLKSAEEFGAAALRHSQCPTALEGGQLGVVKRQQLYPALETTAFALGEGEISTVLESPIGLHILRCDHIFPSGMLSFDESREKIIAWLNEKRRRQQQKNWLRSLTAEAAADTAGIKNAA